MLARVPASSDEIMLAPAAGSGIGKAIAKELLSRGGIVEKLADALENALTATRRTWDSGTKQWVEEPDTRSQLQAVFGLIAHMEGEPIKRVIHQHLGGKGDVDPLQALQDSPALREAAERMLHRAKQRPTKRAETVLDVA
jgi:NAD(P)-dependent dehydrogenase (short-subunit alcohol dehydrogenase family)